MAKLFASNLWLAGLDPDFVGPRGDLFPIDPKWGRLEVKNFTGRAFQGKVRPA
jgi:hypothetical protein